MKKMIILGIIAISVLGIFLFNKNEKSISAGSIEKSRTILFGKVDFSDEDDNIDENDETDEDDNKGNWLENFIKSHKTPFSKTITK